MSGSPGEEAKIITPILFVALIFILDRATKFFILSHFEPGDSLAVWPGIFNLTRVNNTGAAFGLLRGYGWFLVVFSLICVIALIYFLTRGGMMQQPLKRTASLLIIAGALGNMTDRIAYGFVIDFLDFHVWPVFNIADTAISIGVALIIWTIFVERKA